MVRCVVLGVKLEMYQDNLAVAYFSNLLFGRENGFLLRKRPTGAVVGHFYFAGGLSPCFIWASLWSPLLLAVTETSQRTIEKEKQFI